jgi:hypothetical protein
MSTDDVARDLAAAVGQTLPAEYVAFLDGLSSHGEWAEFEFDGRGWAPYDRAQMIELVRYNRDEPHPRAHETRCIVEDVAKMDVSRDDDDDTSEPLVQLLDDDEGGFTLARLARGFCIGDDNGDPLFVDADTGAVFVFCHDGTYLERWADSLVDLVIGTRVASDEGDA